MNSFEAAIRVAARKWSRTSTSAWGIAGGLLLVAVGLIAGFSSGFSAGSVVMLCLGVFVIAASVIVRSIRGNGAVNRP